MKKSRNGGVSRGGGRYSTVSTDYRLLEEIGGGASATVYRAIYVPLNEIVAVKCLDLDRCNTNLDDIRREAQTMSLIDHPNVIIAYCSFVVEHSLWVVMPFMAEGSCLHLMKVAYRDGFEEPAIGSILKETLKALEYLHRHGHIHRDVKAGNILLDGSGLVKLSDFGVSACMFDKGDRQRARNTFVGTPCWMAPEVLQPGSGYNFKADIWSFGITALELAHGHAPFSRYPPMKVLLMTLQNAPPGLDYDCDKKFSKSFKEMVAMCLVKDQTKRPTAEKLLKHSFFKSAKPPELSVKNLLADLPPLWDRVKALQLKDAAQLVLKKMPSAEKEALSQLKDAAQLVLKKMPSAEKEALSQSEYQRGVSAWNFDVEDLKAQASLVQDGDDFSETKEDDGSLRVFINNKDPSTSKSSNGIVPGDNDHRSEDDNQVGTAKYKCDVRKAPNFSGPLMLPYHASANSLSAPMRSSGGRGDSLEDKLMGSVVQIKGRFSVTSENVDVAKDIPLCSVPWRTSQGSSLRKSASIGDWPVKSKQLFTKETTSNSGPASILMLHLQNILQQTSFQQDLIVNLLNSLQGNELDALQTGMPSQTLTAENDLIGTATTERERLLLVRVAKLQERVTSLNDELIAERLKHSQLQEQLTAVYPPR